MRATSKAALTALLLSAALTACGSDGEVGAPSEVESDVVGDVADDSYDDASTTDSGDDAGDGTTTDTELDASSDTGADADQDSAVDTAETTPGSCDAPLVLGDDDLIAELVWQVSGTTLGAPSEQIARCADELGPELAYAFVAPEAGVYRVSLEGADPLLHVRRASCASPAFEVACNDDRQDEDLSSEVVFEAAAGSTFYLLADSYDNESAGPFTMTVSLDPEAIVFELPDGMWLSRGYGLGLIVEAGLVIVIEYSEVHCMATLSLSVSGLSAIISDLELTDDTLTLYPRGTVAPYIFDPITAPPESCLGDLTPRVGDDGYQRNALADLEVLLHTFEEHYAFFALRGIDWTALADAARAMVTEESGDQQLFDAIVSVLQPLNDAHASVSTNDAAFSSKPLRFFAELEQEFEAAGGGGDPAVYFDAQLGAWYAALDALLDGGLQGREGAVVWGRFDDEVGYLNMLHFEFGADGMQDVDDALEALADTSTLVIDIRINGGGLDTTSLDVASRFFEERTLAFTKQTRNGDGFTDLFEAFVDPFDGLRYDGDIVLIVSESTVSAAETFAMTMRQRDNVLIVGQPTAGAFSDVLQRQLPNGWRFGLSNEVYRDAAGVLFEATGIPVDLELPGSPVPLEDRENGTDGWLQTLSLL